MALIGTASAQTTPLTVTLPAGPTGTVVATVNGQVCGTAQASPTGTTVLTLNQVCAAPGSTVSFTSNGVGLVSTLTVPASGSGALVLPDYASATPVTITVPAVPNGSGTISAVVNGQVCATTSVSATNSTILTLPATCAAPNASVTFQGAGGTALTGTLLVPASGGGSLTLPSVTAASPISISVPAGTGTLNVQVDGEICGSVTLTGSASTVALPATCATPGGTITLTNAAGAQVGATGVVPAAGGTVTISSLDLATVTVLLPSGPTGAITATVNGQVCGVATVNSSAAAVLELSGACAIPGATVVLTGPGGVLLNGTLTIPVVANGTVLTQANLGAATPLTVRLPQGSGDVEIIVRGQVCATATLSGTSTTNVSLPATCIFPSTQISFTLDDDSVSQTAMIPAAASGVVTVTQLGDPIVPTPANTGDGVFGASDSSMPFVLGFLTLASVVGLGAAMRRRTN